MKNKLQKALSLSKKTGDRLIVFDLSQNTDPFVVMDLNEYEKIVLKKSEVRGLTEDELLDKINRDIAIWRSDQDGKNDAEKQVSAIDYNFDTRASKAKSFVPIEDIISKRRDDYIPDFGWEDEEDNDEFAEYDFEDNDFEKTKNAPKKNAWKIPSERKEAAEEVIDEDFQYLEKI